MERLDFATFVERSAEFDEAVRQENEIATFCSGSIWQTAAYRSLHDGREDSNFLILKEEETWLVLVEKNENVYFPLEQAWMFGCPLIGNQDQAFELLQRASRDVLQAPSGFVISGILENGSLHGKLGELKEQSHRYEEFPTTDCMTIDLSDGVAVWLARRSKKFRKAIRQIRLPDDFEVIDARSGNPERLMERILSVQRQTYKWKDGTDIFQNLEYEKFYRDIITQLHSSDNLRLLFAQSEGKDIAYILGGISGRTYRGFQMSYAESFSKFGIGNQLQIENIKMVSAEGIKHYDLGMHSPYKERWADNRERYIGIFVVL